MGDLSVSQVNKAGKTLRRFLRDRLGEVDDVNRALGTLVAFRAAHQRPLTTANMGLRSMVKTVHCVEPEISQRLKRVPTIIDKLVREPTLALATMLHRNVVLAHGSEDAWSNADESRLLAQVLADAGNDPVVHLVDGAGHDLSEADDAVIGAFAEALAGRMEPRELPPVLVAIEEMG